MVLEKNEMDGGTVLIVDDVESNRMILREIIQNMDCSPVLAENGKQALEMVKEYNPQLVLTDISMPGMDGYELCRVLKEKEKTKDIPVIFISAYDNPNDMVDGFRLGGADYITKPFIPEVVQARVSVHLSLHQANQGLLQMNHKLQVSVTEQLNQMEQEKKNVLNAIANIVEQNAGYDESYMKRLKRNCGILAQGMQLSPLFADKISDSYVDTIELAVSICDIGKIGIPTELLKKEGNLTEEEAAVMKKHTKIGAKFLEDIYAGNEKNDFIRISTDIIKYHHENWDGSGYPEGLSGNKIPLAAQILAIMDRYCVLTEKGANGREEALEIMKKEAEKKFNPDILSICSKISRQFC